MTQNYPELTLKEWEMLSANYASGASGRVRAVIGEVLRPNNIWKTQELPILERNPKVTSIEIIDPQSGTVGKIKISCK